MLGQPREADVVQRIGAVLLLALGALLEAFLYVLIAVFLLASGQTSVETSEFSSAEDCKAGAEALRAFLTTHETDIVSATWSCTNWDLTQPKTEQPLPKRNL